MKKGVINNSRRESDFINRMGPEQRDLYIKSFIASCNSEELIPFIKIKKTTRYFREVEYEINVPEPSKD
jgi:hypothetical protein